jgi:hypothetical protein
VSSQQLVYEGTDLQDLLRQVLDDHGPAQIRPPERRRKGGIFGFFAREVYVISVEPGTTKPRDEKGGGVGAPGPLAALADATDDVVDLRGGGGGRSFSEVLTAVASSLGEEPGTYVVDTDRLRAQLPAQRPARRDVAREPVGECPAMLGTAVVELARASGVPERFLSHVGCGGPPPTLEAIFAALPAAPPLPTGPGGLVAVTGTPGTLLPVALDVASVVGCPAAQVAFASPSAASRRGDPEHRVRTPAQAAALAGGWRRERTGVVAVSAGPVGADQRWAAEILRALRPSCVWGIASATTKPDDVRRWTDALGGVDAIVLVDATATVTPAAIAALGIPVARLDGAPATPRHWAALLANLVAGR